MILGILCIHSFFYGVASAYMVFAENSFKDMEYYFPAATQSDCMSHVTIP